ncbi:arginase [Acinetobacter marinus]|uniref:Arginase n=2 Tax=Acinetobacter marinus TaxID=281375 RepID=A0A1G6LHV3_9GAMM|nr:arginase [Acinetobacter marinus]
MYAGVHDLLTFESEFVEKFGIQNATAEQLEHSSDPILNWFKSTGAKHLAIHLDLDVLDATQFRSLLFAEPNVPKNKYDGVAQGKMSIELVIKVLNDIAQIADVVGIGIAEHLPWDALALKDMLTKLPLIGGQAKK